MCSEHIGSQLGKDAAQRILKTSWFKNAPMLENPMGRSSQIALFFIFILSISIIPAPGQEESLLSITHKSSMSPTQSAGMYFFDSEVNRHVVDISTDYTEYFCGVKDNGNFSCGGRVNSDFVYGSYSTVLGNFDQRQYTMVVADYSSFCGIETNGDIACIGANNFGQLGNGNTASTTTQLQRVLLPSDVVAVSIAEGMESYCITTSADEIYCWGRNAYQMVKPGSTDSFIHTPEQISLNHNGDIVQLVGGSRGYCALTSTNDVHCWGDDYVQSVLQSDTSHGLFGKNIVDLSMDGENACATTSSAQIFCWGMNQYGAFGNGGQLSETISLPGSPVALSSNFQVVKTIMHDKTVCALSTDSDVACWGKGVTSKQEIHSSPTMLSPPGYISKISDIYFTTNSLVFVSDDGYYFKYLGPHSTEPFYKASYPYLYEGKMSEIYSWSPIFNDEDYGSLSIASHTVPELEITVNSSLPFFNGVPSDWSLQCPGKLRVASCTSQSDMNFELSGVNYTSTFTKWYYGDYDADGIHDHIDLNDDNDGFSDNLDDCRYSYGNSTQTPVGCLDQDGDGLADTVDEFPLDLTQQTDSDSDGFGDNLSGARGDDCPANFGRSIFGGIYGCWDSDNDGWADSIDSFVSDSSQWSDVDKDGFGDNTIGYRGDACPNDAGNSTIDRFGCPDDDGDGHSNGNDDFPNDAAIWLDSDGDGVDDSRDAFPFEPGQSEDTDGDGYGDNRYGGASADFFPHDSTQWSDIDGDGYGDNQNGTNPDAFIADPTQWFDADGDGYGDNPAGRQADAFPGDLTQWEDLDGDGLGDNLSGNNPDPFLFDFDNDGYNDSIDPLPKFASPGDMDYDGTPDGDDLFPSNAREWADTDGDGDGDNADTDDDNDGWPDSEEIRAGTDPYSSASQPVDVFDIVVPGTAIGLGAWDLIGIFGGVPLFAWICFGFVTRNSRTSRFETRLREANSRNELEKIATQWEYALMLRLIGAHQGIRLERLRSELDDWFESQSQPLASVGANDSMHQTHLVEKELNEQDATKTVPSIGIDSISIPTASQVADSVDEDGCEWYTTADGSNFYRTAGSGDEWVKFDD